MRSFLKSAFWVLLMLSFVCCSSSDGAQDQELDTAPSTSDEPICIVSSKYKTGEQVLSAVNATDFDGDCVADDGSASGVIGGDDFCKGGERVGCDDNCTDVYNILQEDADGDGVGDYCDNCVDVANADQADNDIDGMGNACDMQSDHDSFDDKTDNCPLVTNEDQADSDGDGLGDACEDVAQSGSCDNSCDLDGDGLGAACDDDDDGDNVLDEFDVCPFSKSLVKCTSADDADADGVADTLDNCVSVSNVCQVDADDDGMGFECDTNGDDFKDTDGDGIADDADDCDDLFDMTNSCVDTDGDGLADSQDNCDTLADPTNACLDADADGVLDSEDNCINKSNFDQGDSDRDGVGNVCDTEICDDHADNDGDGATDCSDDSCHEKSYCDADDDGKLNSEDPDMDGDGLPNDFDLCKYDDSDPWWLVFLYMKDYDWNKIADGDGHDDLYEYQGLCSILNLTTCVADEFSLFTAGLDWTSASDEKDGLGDGKDYFRKSENYEDNAAYVFDGTTYYTQDLIEDNYYGLPYVLLVTGTLQFDKDEDGVGDACDHGGISAQVSAGTLHESINSPFNFQSPITTTPTPTFTVKKSNSVPSEFVPLH